MDIQTLRQQRLLDLIESHKTIEALADKAGVNSRYLSQIKNGSRRMGAKFARKLEKNLSLPEYWLDRQTGHDEEEFSEELALFRNLRPDQRAVVVELLRTMNATDQ